MPLKLRRLTVIITNEILPQTTGAVSFKRVLGSGMFACCCLLSGSQHDQRRSRGN